MKFMILVESGQGRSRAQGIEREEFDEIALAEATDLAHEMLAHLEREVRRAQARKAAK